MRVMRIHVGPPSLNIMMWNSHGQLGHTTEAMVHMMFCMSVAWVIRISIEASTLLSVLRLMGVASVASFLSIVSTNSFIDLLNSFSVIMGVATLCNGWSCCAMAFRAGSLG